jgi:hypothetical protein
MVPKLVQEWNNHSRLHKNNINNHNINNHKRSMEVWETTCIVTNFAKTADCQILINPTNPQLTGVSKFPYFPKGGPQPKVSPTKDAHHIMGYVRYLLYVILYSFVALVEYIVGE